jgi:predicted NBD/HSP70 family sugar kinase
MNMHLDLNEILAEIKAEAEEMKKNKDLVKLADKIVEQKRNEKPATKEEIDEWADHLSKKLAKLND